MTDKAVSRRPSSKSARQIVREAIKGLPRPCPATLGDLHETRVYACELKQGHNGPHGAADGSWLGAVVLRSPVQRDSGNG